MSSDVNVVVTGTGPHTLVLLHGFSDNLLTWRRVVPALAVEHRVVAIDLPGHGATTRPFQAPLLNGYAALVLEVLDDLGIHERVRPGRQLDGRRGVCGARRGSILSGSTRWC